MVDSPERRCRTEHVLPQRAHQPILTSAVADDAISPCTRRPDLVSRARKRRRPSAGLSIKAVEMSIGRSKAVVCLTEYEPHHQSYRCRRRKLSCHPRASRKLGAECATEGVVVRGWGSVNSQPPIMPPILTAGRPLVSRRLPRPRTE